MKTYMRTSVCLLLAGVLAGVPAWVSAQGDEEGPVVKPRPAEMAGLAAHSLLLDVTNTGKHLIAVGDRGNIVASNDGLHWAQVSVPVRATLTSVDFVDENRGWAVGHDAVILHTRDGGRTWQLQNFQPGLQRPFLKVHFEDASNGVAIGAYGLMMSTSDGGVNWSEVEAEAIREEELHFNDITKLNNGETLLVGESGMMGISRDGAEWERLESPYEGSLYGAVPMGEKGAMVFGLRGNAYLSQDVSSGEWTQIDTGTVASFYGGTLLPSGSVAMVGLAGAVAIVSPDGKVRRTKVQAMAGVTGSGTLAGAIPWKGGVLAVGELGVSQVGL